MDSKTPDLPWMRWLVIAAVAASLGITWPLWQVRTSPPNLPLVDLPQVGMGWPLLLSLGLAAIRPLAGAVAFSGLLLVAIVLDQLRIQPEFLSLAILLWGTLPSSAARLLCRTHLFALWFYAGLHKLLSPGYLFDFGRPLLQRLAPGLGEDAVAVMATSTAVALAATEVAVALLVVAPRTRRQGVWLACAMHAGILVYLILRQRNEAVWPWNVALAMAGFAFFAGWRSTFRASVAAARLPLRGAVALLVISPLGYYFCCVDAYLANCVYSLNTPTAWIETHTPLEDEAPSSGLRTLSTETYRAMRVPFPPAHRMFEQHFDLVGQPGQTLEIRDPRRWARLRGFDRRTLTHDPASAQP